MVVRPCLLLVANKRHAPLYNIFETITITDICTLIKLFSQHLSIYKLLTDSLFNTVASVSKYSGQVFYSHYIHHEVTSGFENDRSELSFGLISKKS